MNTIIKTIVSAILCIACVSSCSITDLSDFNFSVDTGISSTTESTVDDATTDIRTSAAEYTEYVDIEIDTQAEKEISVEPVSINLADIPPFSDIPYYTLNNNVPFFDVSAYGTEPFEYYSPLDSLGRCSVCMACIGKELMPTEERGNIGMVKPTGWHLDKYDFVDGKYLYNRCHIIGHQLTGENNNVQNMITGTRYLNIEGMLPFENIVANYVRNFGGGHVLYRVTPIFEGDNLICTGVVMEGYSVEDNGNSVCFNVFCYNAQPNVDIDYTNGDNWLSELPVTSVLETLPVYTEVATDTVADCSISDYDYVANKNSHVFHAPSCDSVNDMADKNKYYFVGTRDEVIAEGFRPCQRCTP